MALSEYEQEMLEALEAQLTDEDPKLAETFRPARQVNMKHLVIGLLVAVIGVAGLIAGAATGMVWLGILGFVVMLAGALYIGSGPRIQIPVKETAGRASGSFMERQAKAWEKRREQGGRGF